MSRYESFPAEKAAVKPFGKALRALSPLEFIHSDICAYMKIKARYGASYFLTLKMIIHDMGMCTYYLIAMRHLMCSNVL